MGTAEYPGGESGHGGVDSVNDRHGPRLIAVWVKLVLRGVRRLKTGATEVSCWSSPSQVVPEHQNALHHGIIMHVNWPPLDPAP